MQRITDCGVPILNEMSVSQHFSQDSRIYLNKKAGRQTVGAGSDTRHEKIVFSRPKEVMVNVNSEHP